MATAKSALQFEERTGPELVKFDRKGATCEGVLLGITPRTITDEHTKRDKEVNIVSLAEMDDNLTLTGKEFEFIQSADMRSKIRAMDRGKFLRVRYETEQQTKNGKMMVFSVNVSRRAVIGDGAMDQGADF